VSAFQAVRRRFESCRPLQTNMTKSWTLTVQEHEDGSNFIEFPEEVLADANWKEGDTIKWIDLGNGSWSLEKVNAQK